MLYTNTHALDQMLLDDKRMSFGRKTKIGLATKLYEMAGGKDKITEAN